MRSIRKLMIVLTALVATLPRMSAGAPGKSSWFQRFLLPGFARKAVIIGGGYATGRELAVT